jgi:hypothetical protein
MSQGPSLPTVYEQSMTQRINEYYGKSSIFKNNMFYVGLWGQYVSEAMSEMQAATTQDPFRQQSRLGQTKNNDIFETALGRWSDSHWNRANSEVELKWTCSKVRIPTVQTQTEKAEYSIDTIKPINYSLVQNYGGVGTVVLTIVEDKNKMMWHFFNTLHNQFYDAQILKPRSSWHKLGMYCAVMQGDTLNANTAPINEITDEGAIDEFDNLRLLTDVPMMVYEFNSAVVLDVGPMEYDQDNPGMLKFTVQLEVPNTFQGTFKTQFRGLANNTDPNGGYAGTSAVDTNSIQNGSYNKGFFESDIATVSSGNKSGTRQTTSGNITNAKGNQPTINSGYNPNVASNIQKRLGGG